MIAIIILNGWAPCSFRRDLAMIAGRKGNEASLENLLNECHRFALAEHEAIAIETGQGAPV